MNVIKFIGKSNYYNALDIIYDKELLTMYSGGDVFTKNHSTTITDEIKNEQQYNVIYSYKFNIFDYNGRIFDDNV